MDFFNLLEKIGKNGDCKPFYRILVIPLAPLKLLLL